MKDSSKFGFSVSHTTRAPREGEKHGAEYCFTSKEQFAKDVAEGQFLEYAEVHGNMYGTSINSVQSVLESGKCCVLDIDVQGARALRKSGVKTIFVFIAPPSLEELARRLAGRGTESKEQLELRLRGARTEIESLNEKGLYDYLLINDDLEETYQRLLRIATRAYLGMDPEPGQVPERVVLEEAPLPDIPIPVSPSKPASQVLASPEVTNHSGAGAAPSVSIAGNPGMEKWQGKVALVTGASSGIGWTTCEALLSAGMKVVAVARRKDRLEKLQQHITGKLALPTTGFLPVVCDITKEPEVAALSKIVSTRWPGAGIDVLINNAGLSRNDASLFEGETKSWIEMISTNILGTCMCTREVIKDMARRNSYGHIVNMVGLSGHRIPDAPQGGTFYSATKFAVRAITDGLRQEARGRNVPLRVSGISPGIVETEFFTVRNYGNESAAKQVTSNFKCLQPEDIANAVVWCLSAPNHMEVNDIVVRPSEQLI